MKSSIAEVKNQKTIFSPTKSAIKALFRGLFTIILVGACGLCFVALISYVSYWIGYCILLKFSLINISNSDLTINSVLTMTTLGLLALSLLFNLVGLVKIFLSNIINFSLKLGNYQFDEENLDNEI